MAWAALLVMIAVAFVMVVVLGPFGLIILGLMTLFVCSSMQLRDNAPTWGTEVFKAGLNVPRHPEQRAAEQAEKHATLSALRFFRQCGLVLTVAGIAGFVWQRLG